MNAPGWAFNLMVLFAGILLFGGIVAILGLFYWFSPARRERGQGTGNREQNNPVPHAPTTQSPNNPTTQRPGGFGNQGIPRTQSANWRGIPENERGASFFSGRPANVRDMHTTTVSVGGRRRRVLVDDNDYAILQAGLMPPFLMFPFGGGYVPWYAYSDYNPYYDYGDTMPGNYLPYEQVPSQYWEEQPPDADYAYTPDQENFQDYAAGETIGAIDMGNTIAFEEVYRPSSPDDELYRDEAYLNAPNVDPLGDPGASYSGSVDPLGDPAAFMDTSSSFDAGGFSGGGFDGGSGSFDAS